MIRILIADDHAIVREGLKQIVAETSDMLVAGEATSGQQVLDLIREGVWHVILLDIAMPGRGGMETLKILGHERPDIPVLILSMYSEEQYAIRTIKAGAAGYLTKESAPEELISAIRKVSQGGRYVSASLAEKLASHLAGGNEGLVHERLSNREYQVMIMIASGMSVKEIADRLSLSIKTISTNRARIMTKMKMKNNAEIIHYAIKQGLVE